MGALSPILESVEGNRVAFRCPACKFPHVIPYGEGDGPRWVWNGDTDKPTFQPSLLVTRLGLVCHSFITDGNIAFLSDCTHDLAGKTVPIPRWDKED